MKLKRELAEIFVPDGKHVAEALARTTHLAIGAHQDDLEIMAIDGILKCFQREDRWFTGVVVTDGSGSPRSGLYQDYTDKEMQAVRYSEQKKAAIIGGYAAQFFLGYPSSIIKDRESSEPVEDIIDIIRETTPEVVYTHNLADKHLTHIGVTIKVLTAIRALSEDERPKKVYGCEVWRDLGWMLDEDKVAFDCSNQANLQAALLGVYDSQISGGKRYDLATMGRRTANATYFATHDVDVSTGLVFAMDLTPLIQDNSLDINDYVQRFIKRFAEDVGALINS